MKIKQQQWSQHTYPEELYFWDDESATLKRIRFSKELWNKAKTVLKNNPDNKDLITYLKLSDKSEVNKVEVDE